MKPYIFFHVTRQSSVEDFDLEPFATDELALEHAALLIRKDGYPVVEVWRDKFVARVPSPNPVN